MLVKRDTPLFYLVWCRHKRCQSSLDIALSISVAHEYGEALVAREVQHFLNANSRRRCRFTGFRNRRVPQTMRAGGYPQFFGIVRHNTMDTASCEPPIPFSFAAAILARKERPFRTASDSKPVTQGTPCRLRKSEWDFLQSTFSEHPESLGLKVSDI